MEPLDGGISGLQLKSCFAKEEINFLYTKYVQVNSADLLIFSSFRHSLFIFSATLKTGLRILFCF
jgi:hypothetical protein